MADSRDSAASSEGPGSLLPCDYCPQLGADVCVRITPSASGAGHAIHAHRACAETHGDDVLYTVVAGQAS